MEKVKVGKIVNTIGLKGQLKFLLSCPNAGIIKPKTKIFVGQFEDEFECEKFVKKADNIYNLKLAGLDDINLVEKFKNCDVFVEHSKQNLNADEFFVDDLVGCQIIFDGKPFGVVTDVENFGASDIIVFESDGIEHRVPFVSTYIGNVDTEKKQIFATQNFLEGVV